MVISMLSIVINGYWLSKWLSRVINSYQLVINGYQLLTSYQWFSRVMNGYQWFSRVMNGYQWLSMVLVIKMVINKL